jgi:hypothetical protein
MFLAILAAIESIKSSTRGDRHRNPLSPRKDRHRSTVDEPPNPDFDFGPNTAPLAFTQQSTAERRFGRVLLVLMLLALLPIGLLVVAFLWY